MSDEVFYLCHKCEGVAAGESHPELYDCGCISTGSYGDTYPLPAAKECQRKKTVEVLALFRSQGRTEPEIERLLGYRRQLHNV